MTMDFRTRSADVRREAADILWRFRSSRAARRGGPGGAATSDVAAPTHRVAVPVSPETADLIRVARGGGPALAEGGPDVRETFVPNGTESVDVTKGDGASAMVGEAEQLADEAAGAPTIADVAEAEIAVASAQESPAPDGPSQNTAGPVPEDGCDRAADQAARGKAPQRGTATDRASLPDNAATGAIWPGPGDGPQHTDLMELPGIGAGLVWLLGRCGINSLADLAAVDASKLERDLGLVGQLLDLPSWIALAGQAIATGNDDTDAEGKLEE